MLNRLGFGLAGRRALVTGGDSGIGHAIACALAAAGARVAINGLGDFAAVASDVAADAVGIAGDIGDEKDRARLVDEICGAFGAIDILVLNAAVEIREPWREVSDAAMERQIAVNLVANVKLIQAFVPAMAEAKWGRVVAISSVQNVKPHPQLLIYAGLKATLDNMMKNLSHQLADRGVTFNSIAPGAMQTNRNAKVLSDPAYRTAVLAKIPAASFGAATDCAGAALLLCSDAGRYITGAVIPVDGGMSF